MRLAKEIYLPIILTTLICILAAYLIQTFIGSAYLLEDIASTGWLLGVVGTIYTLISAFTIVEVWNQFNEINSLISKEAITIISIWNYANYFNDGKLDIALKGQLISYIEASKEREHEMAIKGIRSDPFSQELLGIHKTFDDIGFDDGRDATVFPLLAKAYDDLCVVRSSRIEASVGRLPALLKFFFCVLSFMLIASYLLVGYTHFPLYLLHTAFGAFTISVVYKIITDLDNPFKGFWNINYDAFEEAKAYILSHKH